MLIGIITDIHANIQALETVLRALEREGIDYLACLGDIVGYGGDPDLCCDLVRRHADVTVVGNHDAAVAGRMTYGYYRQSARDALDKHREMISDENLSWLKGLPYDAWVDDVRFCHGLPPSLEEFDYLFTLEQVTDLARHFHDQAHVTFVGHSHLCKCFDFTEFECREVLRTRFSLDVSRKYIISAGSVGQPRDYDSRSCCATYDTETKRFTYLRLGYDIAGARRAIEDADLAPAFGRRLEIGV